MRPNAVLRIQRFQALERGRVAGAVLEGWGTNRIDVEVHAGAAFDGRFV